MIKGNKVKGDYLLIILCWLAYTFAQLGRYSYNSNVIMIMDRFAIDHATASIPATLFFFAYGAGQIVVGFLCGRFNRRTLVTLALLATALLNIAVFFSNKFFIIKYIWLLNGFAQAVLWPTLLLILRENVSAEKMEIASVVMATASLGGRFVAMGVCALFAIDASVFTYCFLAAGIVLILIAAVFFAVTGDIKKPEKNTIVNFADKKKDKEKVKADKYTVFLLILLGEFSFACYAISGGLQQWVPSIMKENYGLTDSISIFVSTFLPLFSLPSALIAPYLCRKLKNYALIA
ncbi:MAG: MFS transporter, partial [Clostridia bacterium]|nr:MFS transporter [Clostridia bacterium]